MQYVSIQCHTVIKLNSKCVFFPPQEKIILAVILGTCFPNVNRAYITNIKYCQEVWQLKHTPSTVMLWTPKEGKKLRKTRSLQSVVTELEQWYWRRRRWVLCLFVSVRRGVCLEYRAVWSNPQLTYSLPETDTGGNRISPTYQRWAD